MSELLKQALAVCEQIKNPEKREHAIRTAKFLDQPCVRGILEKFTEPEFIIPYYNALDIELVRKELRDE